MPDNIEVIHVSIDTVRHLLTLQIDWLVVGVLLLIAIIVVIMTKVLSKVFRWQELEVEISGSPKIVYKVQRNDENLYIANRIHIELTTRKAALPLDVDKDLIEEVYDSWYKLFGIIREEIKSLPGKYLRGHDPTSALIGLTRNILNDALRPHLTEHQAKFRVWWEEVKKDPNSRNKTPQQLQKEYPDIASLVASMKQVNVTLISYAKELDKLIKG